MPEETLSLGQRAAIRLIRWYQASFSPDHGIWSYRYPYGYCRFTPTCSQYAADAIAKYGVLSGIARGTWRIIRCNPWNRGGSEPA